MSQQPMGQTNGWIVAVDGGGSKIAIAAAPSIPLDAAVLPPRLWHFDGTGSAHPSTWTQAVDNLCRALEQVALDLRQAARKISAVKLALAGAGRPDDQLRVVETLKARCPWLLETSVHCMGDIEPLVDYHHAQARSIAVILGTGSVVASRNEAHDLVRAGGWGPLLGDACSGGAIGLSALRYVSQLIDEGQASEQFSGLAQAIVAELQTIQSGTAFPGGHHGLQTTLNSLLIQTASDRTQTARLAGVVLVQAYETHDRDALELLESHLADIVWQIRQVARRAGINEQPIQMNFTGGIAEHHGPLRQAITQACVAAGLNIIAEQIVDPLQAMLNR